MAVRLMTQRMITGAHLQSVTEQAGPRMGPALPDDANDGFMRAVMGGELSAPTMSGVEIELMAGGDTGAATFRWREAGGTWQGRDDPAEDDYWTGVTVHSNGTYGWGSESTLNNPMGGMVQAANGDLVMMFARDDSDADTRCDVVVTKSTDSGTTWSTPVVLRPQDTNVLIDIAPGGLVVLSTGRILASTFMEYDSYIYASDDDGDTWVLFGGGQFELHCMVELPNGNVIGGAWDRFEQLYTLMVSDDRGARFIEANHITPSPTTNSPRGSDMALLPNGDVLFVWGDDTGTDKPIKGTISSNNGVSWTVTADPMPYTAYNFKNPSLEVDIDGRVFCMATRDETNDVVAYSYSEDAAETWTYDDIGYDILTSPGNDVKNPAPCIVDGHTMLVACMTLESSNHYVKTVSRGGWEAYSSNACPCAPGLVAIELSQNARVTWHGGEGVVGDSWMASVIYDYSAKNMVDEDSPSVPWRSLTDDLSTCVQVWAFGATNQQVLNGVAFRGANVRTLGFEAHTSDSWGAPDVYEIVSFDIDGGIGSVNGTVIGNAVPVDAVFAAAHADHALAGMSFRATAGTDDGETWRVLDNAAGYVFLSIDATTGLADTDTFAVFSSDAAVFFEASAGIYSHCRVWVDPQKTADGYYEIGTMVPTGSTALARGISVGMDRPTTMGATLLETPGGGLITAVGRAPRREWLVTFPAVAEDGEVLSVARYADGGLMVLIMDDTATRIVPYLVYLRGDVDQSHRSVDFHDVAIELVEVI